MGDHEPTTKRSIKERLSIGIAGGLFLLLLADLTALRGEVPNWIFIAAWSGFVLWGAATGDATQTKHARESAERHGLTFLSQDGEQLPSAIPYRLLLGTVRNVRVRPGGPRVMYVLDVDVREERVWYDDEPSTHRLAVCCLQMRGGLPAFHVEVGGGWRRIRGSWGEPRVDLSGTKPKIKVDPLPSHVQQAIFHPGMLEWLAGLGPCLFAVSGSWLSFSSEGSVYRTSSSHLMAAATGFEDRIRGEAFDA